MNRQNAKNCFTIAGIFLVLVSVALYLPSKSVAATLSTASATLSNPRLSYRANTNPGAISGTSSVVINSSSAYPDFNTNHLFPGDNICFINSNPVGCLGNVSYSVATVSGAQTFSISSPLVVNTDTAGYVIATQSGSITLTFNLVSTIPAGGDIYIKIPVASTGNTNDGFPDTGTSNSTDGFDFNKLAGGSVTISSAGGSCTGTWGTPSVTASTGVITIGRSTGTCSGSTLTIVIPNMVNPTPFITNHQQGTADPYKIYVATRDGSTNALDSTNVVVAPIEGVLISASVDQTLSFTVAGIASGQSICNATTTVATSPYAVPWGNLAIANTFSNAAQLLSVSTNADNGYVVTIEQNDQMGMNGGTCTGITAGEAQSCIKDTACDSGTCNYANYGNWVTSTFNGLGYSMATVSGNAASFYWGGATNWYAKALPDQESSLAKQIIMSSTGPVSNNQADVCYRISVSGTQPAGYYYNKVKYTATARF